MDQNLPWGAPKGGAGKGGCLLVQKNFVTAYSSSLKVPLLVGYKLEASVTKFFDLCNHFLNFKALHKEQDLYKAHQFLRIKFFLSFIFFDLMELLYY